jgi:hypothetical protein
MVYSGSQQYPEERQARIAIIPWILLSVGWALLAGALLFLAVTARKVPSEPLTKIITQTIKVAVPGPATVTVVGENGALGNLPGTGSTASNAGKAGSGRAGASRSSRTGRVVDDMCPCHCPSQTGVSVTVPGVTSVGVKAPSVPALPVPTPSLPGTSLPKVP